MEPASLEREARTLLVRFPVNIVFTFCRDFIHNLSVFSTEFETVAKQMTLKVLFGGSHCVHSNDASSGT